jgi:alginate O-acetyltransferase complex protein AlgI
MSFEFNAVDFFVNLLAITIFILPLYYWLRSADLQRLLLSAAGFYLIFCIAPRLLVVYLIFWVLIWLLQKGVSKWAAAGFGWVVLWISLLMTLTPMVIWKIFDYQFVDLMNFKINDFLWYFARPIGEIDSIRTYIIPIGLSFATFRALDILIKMYLYELPPFALRDTLFYGFFPPVFPIGPIIEYNEIKLDSREKIVYSRENLVNGFYDLASGFFKIYILAYPLKFTQSVFQNYTLNSPLILIPGILLFSFYFYFNFSGYSSVAIGLARLFGFSLNPNFNFPLFSNNPQEFWSRWHMSLTRFAQRYIFVPCGGYRSKTQYWAIYATMMTIALWHDLTPSWFLFGIYHGTAIALHRFWTAKKLETPLHNFPEAVKKVFKTCLLIIYVSLGFPIIMLPPGDLLSFYLKLLGVQL